MHCHNSLSKIEYGQGTAIALGYFDGVHLGHRAVLNAAMEDAAQNGLLPAAFTFALPTDGGFKGKRILSPEEKRRRVARLGIRFYLRPPFEQFCTLSPTQFVNDMLKQAYGARSVFCGNDFTFGKNKAGNVETLKELCAQAGIRVTVVPMAQYEGETISSTRIRACLSNGDIEAVNAMLGAPYAIETTVQHGKQIGRTLGFPTINQRYEAGTIVPKSGVYLTKVILQDGTQHIGATGLGSRPTVNQDVQDITCETFMPQFTGDIYGARVRLQFYHYLKPTCKFENKTELQAYIDDAAQQAIEYFSKKV